MTEEKLELIKKFVFEGMPHNNHNFAHLERVRKNSVEFAKILGVAKDLDLLLLQAACYLHDITYIKHKNGLYTYIFERKLVAEELKNILPKFDISIEEAKIIIRACSKHVHSIPFRRLNKKADLYTKLLQDSDSADYFHNTRVRAAKEKMTGIPYFGKFLAFMVDKYTRFGINNLRYCLNFPELYEQIRL